MGHNVRSYVEYCAQIWAPYQLKEIQFLEKVQKRATSLVKGMSKYKYAIPDCGYWNLYSLLRRRERGDMIETYKLLNKMENVA